MIFGITFLGEERRGTKGRLVLSGMYVAGGVVGGAVTGALLWLLAAPIRTFLPSFVVWVFAGAICLACFLADLGVIHRTGSKRQVPASWFRRFGPLQSYTMYGAVLGSGLFTAVPYAATYALYGFSVLVLPVSSAVAAGAIFGGARAILAGPASFLGDSILGSLGTTGLKVAYRVLPRASALICGGYLVTLVVAWPE